MAPPQFKNLGKKTADLFKKQYDYKNELKVVSKSSGAKIESGGYQAKGGLVGYTKANWTDSILGDAEMEIHSSGTAKQQFKLNNITDGVNATFVATGAGAVSVDTTYEQDLVSANFKAAHNLRKSSTALSASAVCGYEGVLVGGNINFDVANLAAPTDYNFGAEYSQKDLTATLVTSNKLEDITASYFQKVSGDVQLGASITVKPETGTRLFTFGTNYVLDKATTIKAKANSSGIVGTSVTHVLAAPKAKVCISAEFDSLASDSLRAQKLGVSVNLGEF
jgi:voltage-dependent anion channel protein 2